MTARRVVVACTVIACLLIGLAINLGVAIRCEERNHSAASTVRLGRLSAEQALRRRSRLEPSWPAWAGPLPDPTEVRIVRSPGFETTDTSANPIYGTALVPELFTVYAEWVENRAGWPLHAVRHDHWTVRDWPLGTTNAGYNFGSDGAVRIHRPRLGLVTVTVAYRPVWPGLILNTLLYALLPASVAVAFVALRRRRRRRRGHCPACGYDRRGDTAAVCPECGRAATTAAEGTTPSTSVSRNRRSTPRRPAAGR